MRRRRAQSRPEELDARGRDVLARVVQEFVREGRPVASASIARLPEIGLSPASIRSLFARLEEQGYLYQPHTSAGRVPTEKAYRLYVDTVLGSAKVTRRDREGVAASLVVGEGLDDAETLLNEASRVLSRLSSQVGVVVAPPLGRIILRRIGFVKVGEERVVVVLVAESGVVHHRVVRVGEPVTQRDLDRASRYLESEFGGLSLAEIHGRLRRLLAAERARYDRLVRHALTLASLAVQDEGDAEVFLDGVGNLVRFEPGTLQRIQELLQALQEKENVVRLLEPCLEREGVYAAIGSETGDPDLEDMAVLATSYRIGERPVGSVGIIGPSCMDYDRLVGLVAYTGKRLSRLLTEGSW
jgi:heat-inducible transcriptional repressor